MGGISRISAPAPAGTGNLIRDSALALASETLDTLVTLSGGVWTDGTLSPTLLELLRLRNAKSVNCTVCKAVRYDVAKQDGLTEERIAQLNSDRMDEGFSDRERAAIAFADAYLGDPAAIPAETAARIRSQFSEAEIAQMAVALVTFNLSSRCAVSLGGLPESVPVMEVPVAKLVD
ncbi:carboxymuconolactone decarboxylase family protein [Flavisphingomonas formosensis]|uniref:carboxymuconolactone decarboxylase family protein n=1 Tax=Flavisphingomonas formosensis TaxID=861534 RepID=UPI0012FAD8B0|nr:carboxymuconolactone decarboxylase family protein [Sphingomonas formosensis]